MHLWTALFGPRLYAKYGEPREESTPEFIGNTLLAVGRCAARALISTFPLVFGWALWRGSITQENLVYIATWTVTGACVSWLARAFGRLADPQYTRFAVTFEKAQQGDRDALVELKTYDYDLATADLYDFEAKERQLWYYQPTPHSANPLVRFIAYILVHAVGLSLMFPGSFQLMAVLAQEQLLASRENLITKHSAKRAVLKTQAGDLIDTIYVDTRRTRGRSEKLVICCEGNASFYELGMMAIPLNKGCCVLGWNYPGFVHSTGTPLPANVLAAADAVMQYAMGPLGWPEEDIVLYAWSIGGFAASWLAANHQKIRALLLDATFDDVLPLALDKMPAACASIVEAAVRGHLNLDIAAHLREYKGPVRIYRRLQDQMMCTGLNHEQPDFLTTCRTNWLLKVVLNSRHPGKVKGREPTIDAWLMMSDIQRKRTSNLATPGESAVYHLCQHYFADVQGHHMMPLPVENLESRSPSPRGLRTRRDTIDDATIACDDLTYFERRLKEVITHAQPRATRWRLLLLIASVLTVLSSYYWLRDPEIRNVTLAESLYTHFVFTCCVPMMLVLIVVFGIHRQIVAPSIIAARCREALAAFSLSCDENGKLIVRPAMRNSP
ncbi:unnamed protein product, partial [Mesorhabditis spiculigera]